MKIYTKTGDQGETGLLGGARVDKNHAIIVACGDVDETNSQIGMAMSHGDATEYAKQVFESVQRELFVVGTQLAGCTAETKPALSIEDSMVERMEQQIDKVVAGLPALDAFILPGGCSSASQLHIARSVCRRAERSTVELIRTTELAYNLDQVVVYLNRLSDLLFVLARHENSENRQAETKWLP